MEKPLPKKRGRKPKGGKIVKMYNTNEIIYIKGSLKDWKESFPNIKNVNIV